MSGDHASLTLTISSSWMTFRLFGKSYEQLDSLVHAVHTFNKDIRMEFGIKVCGALVLPDGEVNERYRTG